MKPATITKLPSCTNKQKPSLHLYVEFYIASSKRVRRREALQHSGFILTASLGGLLNAFRRTYSLARRVSRSQ